MKLLPLIFLLGAGVSSSIIGVGGAAVTKITCTSGCSQAGTVLTVNATAAPISATAGYTGTGTQTIAAGATDIIDFATLIWDPDGAVTTGASWHYTVPTGKAGRYLVEVILSGTNSGTASNNKERLQIHVGGSFLRYLDSQRAGASGRPPDRSPSGAAVVNLADGNQVDVRYLNGGAGGRVFDRSLSWISIARLP